MITEIKMISNAAIAFGKDYVGGICVTMEDHATCMVADNIVRVSF